MPVLGNVLLALGVVIQNAFLAYSLVLLARAVVSWVDADPRNPIVRLLHAATDPVLRVVRRMLPTNLRFFPIDVAFLVVVAMVLFAQYTVAQTLIDIGSRLRRPVLVEPV